MCLAQNFGDCTSNSTLKQEYSPVGCVPSATVAVSPTFRGPAVRVENTIIDQFLLPCISGLAIVL